MAKKHTTWMAAVLAAAVAGGGAAWAAEAPADDSPWGVMSHPLWSKVEADYDAEVRLIREAGIRWMRTDFGFGRGPDAEGRFDFGNFEKLYDQFAVKGGIRILPILQGYDWEIPEKYRPLHKHPEVWRNYVRQMGERFKGRIKVYQIWNEQDGGFWKPRPDAAQYVSLLKIAHEELKRIDPENRVIAGALCGWKYNYLADLYAAGAKGHFDILAVHPYLWGPDREAARAAEMARFKAVMAKHGQSDTPIWITECGAATFQARLLEIQPDIIPAALRLALRRIGRAASGKLRIGVPLALGTDDPGMVERTRPWLPGIELTPVSPEALAKVDPAELPCMIGTEGLDALQPYLAPMRDYVARGGVLLASGMVPFYVEVYRQPNGIWAKRDNAGEMHRFLRIGFEAWWTKKGLPHNTFNVRTTPGMDKEGIKPIESVYLSRYLSGKNLREGDRYTPIIDVLDPDGGIIGQGMAIYTFKDWKGAILGNTLPLERGPDLAEQANLLQRVYLAYLSEGVSKIFVYNLRNKGTNRAEVEDNFGIVERDFSPKPAYTAYKTMIDQLGSAPTFVGRIDTKDSEVWALRFKRVEDGKTVAAFWATRADKEYTLAPFGTFRGESVRFREE